MKKRVIILGILFVGGGIYHGAYMGGPGTLQANDTVADNVIKIKSARLQPLQSDKMTIVDRDDNSHEITTQEFAEAVRKAYTQQLADTITFKIGNKRFSWDRKSAWLVCRNIPHCAYPTERHA